MKLQQVKELIKKENLEYFLCSFVEMNGVPKAKVVPVTQIDDMAADGAGFAGFAAGDIGQAPHHNDLMAVPDFDSLTPVPWRRNMAWVAGDSHVDGKSWPYCPRTILKRQVATARKQGYVFKTGVEPEFILVRRLDGGGYAPYDPLDTLKKPCYDLQTLTRNLDVITTVMGYMQQLGWKPSAGDHEDANCQFEINWNYAEGLTTADRNVFFRWMVKTVAEQHGLLATFMPKPFGYLTGNGCHFHISLWNTSDKNIFLDQKDRFGLSMLAYNFIGGLKAHAKAVSAVTAPTVNSYKRLVKRAPNSGATWAPVYISYGPANRTQMIRLPGPGRIENRTVDGAANPYLASTVLLAAGLDGIKHKLPAGEANQRNLYEASEADLERDGIDTLPTSLAEALDALEKDPVIMDALGSDYGPYYVKVKREEWRRYHNAVSNWEVDNYIEMF